MSPQVGLAVPMCVCVCICVCMCVPDMCMCVRVFLGTAFAAPAFCRLQPRMQTHRSQPFATKGRVEMTSPLQGSVPSSLLPLRIPSPARIPCCAQPDASQSPWPRAPVDRTGKRRQGVGTAVGDAAYAGMPIPGLMPRLNAVNASFAHSKTFY